VSIPTNADSIALSILIAGRDCNETPVPRTWIAIATRLRREGYLRITATERVFRISGDGLAELARLQRMGAVPAEFRSVRKKAHDGGETGCSNGREMRRRSA
jgi:hypothetical protein